MIYVKRGNLLSLSKMSWSQGKSCGVYKCRERACSVTSNEGPILLCVSLPARDNIPIESRVFRAQGTLRDLSIAPEKLAVLVTQGISVSTDYN